MLHSDCASVPASAREIENIVIIHAAAEWRTFHRRAMLLAVAEALPRTAALLCVNRPISVDVAPWKHMRKFWSGIWRVGVRAETSRAVVATPRLLLHEELADGIAPAKYVNRYLMRSQLSAVLRKYFPNAKRLVQWIYYPVQHWVWEIFPSSGKVYECYDEYARSPRGELDPEEWEAELRVVSEADLTFATARSLIQTRAPMARRLASLPNGVPDAFFDIGQEVTPDPIDAVPHPRIGYVGNIRRVLDFHLLENVFFTNPKWHLVLVGPIAKGAPTEKLRKMKNVHFLGPRPHNQVPGVLRRMDVGLIPFVMNDFTRAINPLKFYEYIAVGLPVVATKLPELERFRGLICLEDNGPAEFASGIQHMMAADRASLGAKSVWAARPYSWTNIARRSVVPELRDVFGF